MDKLPLFPLPSVLFPGGYLPLRIFEVRYLDMIARCQREGAPFGVVALTAGGEVQKPDVTEAFHAVGTLAHIEALERPQPGLLHIRCRGGRRFRLGRSERLSHGLWIGDAELLPDDASVPVPEDLAAASRLLQQLLHDLEQGAAAEDMPIQPPYLWHDSGWLANRWSELLPLPADERQRLMELDNPLVRLELVSDQLDRLDRAER